ncbi:MAG: hypothetical protein Q8N51_07685 [Gammaproteobacteria bacterium]|nr:hypothetical protein [Gammaproteobacteria bacterium]
MNLMAKILFGPLVAEARGKEGGIVFSRNRYGAYIRAKTSPVQPRTPAQNAIRAAFTVISQSWRDLLVATERAAWDDYAKQTPVSDRYGAKIDLTGNTMFLRYNAALVGILATPLKVAPTLPGEAEMPRFTLTGTVAAGVKIATLAPVIAAGDYVLAYSNKAPIPVSRAFFNGPWTLRKIMDTAQTFPAEVVPIAECAIGQRWWVKCRLYKANGKVGPLSMISVDILA